MGLNLLTVQSIKMMSYFFSFWAMFTGNLEVLNVEK